MLALNSFLKMKFKYSLIFLFVFLFKHGQIECQNKRNSEACLNNNECSSRKCSKNICESVRCLHDHDCLFDQYCHIKSFLLFDESEFECIRKKGF
jgi:hypothetical protein